VELDGQACIDPRHECNDEEKRGGVRRNVGLYTFRWDGYDNPEDVSYQEDFLV